MVEVALLFGLLSYLAQEGAVMFADSLAGPLVSVEEGSAASKCRVIGEGQGLLMLPSNCRLFEWLFLVLLYFH
jgi:hypothetical protein